MMINQVVKLPISQKYQGARSRKCGLLSIFFCACASPPHGQSVHNLGQRLGAWVWASSGFETWLCGFRAVWL